MEEDRRPDRLRAVVAVGDRGGEGDVFDRRDEHLPVLLHNGELPHMVEAEHRDRHDPAEPAVPARERAEEHAAKQHLLRDRRHEHRDGEHLVVFEVRKLADRVVVRRFELAEDAHQRLQPQREHQLDRIGDDHREQRAAQIAHKAVKALAQEVPERDEHEHEADQIIDHVRAGVGEFVRTEQQKEHRHEKQRQQDDVDRQPDKAADPLATQHQIVKAFH